MREWKVETQAEDSEDWVTDYITHDRFEAVSRSLELRAPDRVVRVMPTNNSRW